MSAQEGPTPNEVLWGNNVEVVYEKTGEKEAIKLREIPVEDWEKAVVAESNEFLLVELFAGKPPGWSKTIKPESFDQIITTGERLNARFFGFCERTETRAIKRLRRVAPEKLEEVVSGIMSPSPSQNGLQRSAVPLR